MKKNRGRPPQDGVTYVWHFGRACKVLRKYNQVRAKGEKHSSAIRETVEAVLLDHPEMHISESVVKRILAEFQSERSPTAFLIDYSILEGPGAAFIRSRIRLQGVENKADGNIDDNMLDRPLKRFTISIGPRPIYSRHNAKSLSPKKQPLPLVPDSER